MTTIERKDRCMTDESIMQKFLNSYQINLKRLWRLDKGTANLMFRVLTHGLDDIIENEEFPEANTQLKSFFSEMNNIEEILISKTSKKKHNNLDTGDIDDADINIPPKEKTYESRSHLWDIREVEIYGENVSRVLHLPFSDTRSYVKAGKDVFIDLANTGCIFRKSNNLYEIRTLNGIQTFVPISDNYRLRVVLNTLIGESRKSGICEISTDTFKHYIQTDSFFLLPEVKRVIDFPLFVRNDDDTGQIVQNAYDYRNKILSLYRKSDDEFPSFEEAKKRLCAIVDAFEFTSSGDKSRAMAAIITPMLQF